MKIVEGLIFGAVISLLAIAEPSYGYRILAVFPAPSISHQVVFRALTLALNKRGHELVVVTPDPVRDSTLVNYTEIDISAIYDGFNGVSSIAGRLKMTTLDLVKQMDPILVKTLLLIFEHPEMKKLYAPDSGEKFDLLIIELMFWDAILPLTARFNVPIIGISSLGVTTTVHHSIGNPIMSYLLDNWELGHELSRELTFWQRLKNFYTVWEIMHWYKTDHIPRQEAFARKYFGNDMPNIEDLWKNVSLIFVNQQGPISYARPNVPNIIQIGGFHVAKKTTDMPKDLRKLLDKATTGFIYVSLGSNVKSNELPKKTRDTFIAAFSKLPYKVLWKFEDSDLPGKPDNVHIMKWVPQQAVLAHPNLKAFVYQGGLQSTEEAVTHGVPLIGLPVFGDQDMQVFKMASLGVAKQLEISTVNENELFEAISTVATDVSYKQKMMNLRSLINDKPHDPLENAVWWTEHVIRHKGAPHLRSKAVDLPWYTRQDMDIVASITAAFLILVGLTLVIAYHLIRSICHTYSGRTLAKKKTN